MPDLVSRFDEGAPDIMVSDNAELKGNAGFLGIANGRGHTRIRHRNDNVRIDVAFARQFGSDTFPNVINIASFQMTVGTGKIDILKNVNLSVKKGEMVGIIGLSGAGKTTLFDLLLRLFTPNSGYITLDGEDIYSIKMNDWREHVGYISQDIFLTNDTIANNIDFTEIQ